MARKKEHSRKKNRTPNVQDKNYKNSKYTRTRDYKASRESMEERDDVLEGRNPIIEALKAGRSINKILLAKGEREGSIIQIIALAKERGVIIQEVERQNLDRLSLTNAHQGVIAYVAAKSYVEVDDILEIASSKNESPFIVILDEINDPHNLGSILRTADAVGAHGVIIPKRRAVGLTPVVSKASAGAIEYVPVARVSNISQTIDYLKKKNIWVVGTDNSSRREDTFYNRDLTGPIALVIGSTYTSSPRFFLISFLASLQKSADTKYMCSTTWEGQLTFATTPVTF
jgi:23S rRNA (guanosine2251-2'-O)-methyltransferase